jgi:hypothetical protein
MLYVVQIKLLLTLNPLSLSPRDFLETGATELCDLLEERLVDLCQS